MATYYVDATLGNNANSGLTTLLPWQTIAKVNTASASMTAGDKVLFKRGETWTGTALRPDGSGSVVSPITFGAYGSGALPVIGAGAAWTSMAIDTDIAYIRFEYIDFTGSNGANYAAAMVSGHDVTCYGCIFRDGDYMGFLAFSTTGALQYNIVVSHCYAYNNVASGICITSNDGSLGPSTGNVVEYCVAYNNGTTRWADHGIYCRYGATIRYNECYGNLVGGGIKVNCQATASSWYPTVYGNKCYGNFQGIICDNWDALIYNNLFYGNEWNVGLSSGSAGMTFVFNTILNAAQVTTAADGIKVFNISQLASGMTIENNLIIQDRAVSAYNVWAKTGTGDLTDLVAENVIDYNVYYTDATVGTDIMLGAVAYNWTEWLALTGSPDAHSTFLLALPDLISRYTNVGLTVGSNVYGLGIAISGITTDRFGTVRPNPPSPGYFDIAATTPQVGTFANITRIASMTGTQANIEAGSSALEEIRFAVDTANSKLGIYTGGAWYWGLSLVSTAWTDWTPSLTGWSTDPTNCVYRYRLVGNTCELVVRQANPGTSDSTIVRLTLPFRADTITNMYWVGWGRGRDNDAILATPVMGQIAANDNVLAVYPSAAGGNWTASSVKGIYQLNITYEIAVSEVVNTIWTIGPSVTTINGWASPYTGIQPGDTIVLTAGTRGPLNIKNIAGTAANPITIINGGGQVVIEDTESWYGFWLQNCQHVRLTGTGDPGETYGIQVADANNNGIIFQNKSEYLEFDHIEILDVAAGIGIQGQTVATTEGDYDYDNDGVTTDDVVNRTNFVQHDIIIHDCLMDGGTGVYAISTGIYVGSSSWLEDDTQPECSGLYVYDNIIRYLSHKGIQAGSVIANCEIHDNVLTACNATLDQATNKITININPGCTDPQIWNNQIIDCLGVGIYTLGIGGMIWNNLLVRPGRTGTSYDAGITVSYKGGYTHPGDPIYIFHNTIIDAPGNVIEFSDDYGAGSDTVQNNIFVGHGSDAGDTYVNHPGTVVHDHNLEAVDVADCFFTAEGTDDYTLTENSPAIDVGADVSAYGIADDIVGTARPAFSGYDLGCYESTVEYVEYVPTYIILLDFADGTSADFSSVTDTETHLAVNATAGMGGETYGLEIEAGASAASFGAKNVTASNKGKVRLRYYFDPNTLTMSASDQFTQLVLYNSSVQAILLLDFIFTGGVYKVFTRTYNDTPAVVDGTAVTISDAAHYIEVYLQRSSSSGASDGSCQMWIDGSSVDTVTGVDNYDRFPDFAHLYFGIVSGLDAGTTGTIYLAKLQLNNTGTAIGA